tara:strand:+ start:172 stop:1152 length:981 start_codon:yes stop_codon:yes gene_type:complete
MDFDGLFDISRFEGDSVFFTSKSSLVEGQNVTISVSSGPDVDKIFYSSKIDLREGDPFFIAHPCLLTFRNSKIKLSCDSWSVEKLLNTEKQESHPYLTLGPEIYEKIEHVINWSYYTYFSQEIDRSGFKKFIKDYEFENVIDLGSNLGFVCRFLSQYRDIDKYICVEPNAKLNKYNRIINEGLVKDLVIYDRALHYTNDDTLRISIPEASIDSGLSSCSDSFVKSSNHLLEDKDREYHEVKTINLERLLKNNNLKEIDLIKADIEGAEEWLVEGANFDILSNSVRAICLEIHNHEGAGKHVRDSLLRAGFKIKSQHKLHSFLVKDD